MTRLEHIQWCKDRAIAEIEYLNDPKQGIISMMSDLTKHGEVNPVLQQMCMIQLLSYPNMTKAQAIEFINGFN